MLRPTSCIQFMFFEESFLTSNRSNDPSEFWLTFHPNQSKTDSPIQLHSNFANSLAHHPIVSSRKCMNFFVGRLWCKNMSTEDTCPDVCVQCDIFGIVRKRWVTHCLKSCDSNITFCQILLRNCFQPLVLAGAGADRDNEIGDPFFAKNLGKLIVHFAHNFSSRSLIYVQKVSL